jgi:hypothetical protein
MPTNTPTNSTGDYDAGKGEIDRPNTGAESAKAGYEMTDVNAGGIVVFLGGLFGFVIVFFFFCYFMGRLINVGLAQDDARQFGPIDKWHQQNNIFAGAKNNGGKREDLKSNAAIEQQQFKQMTEAFPGPRLQTDDGNQDTADLHAREDLLLDHYSSVPGEPIRIPIDRAMQLIAAKGLPVSQTATPATSVAMSERPAVQVPLTTGFARTGYELDQMEARQQRLDFGKAEASEHAELKPAK